MSPMRLIPLVSLALVLVVLGSALLIDRPVEFPYSEPPEGMTLPSVRLGLGDLTLRGEVVDRDGQPIDGAGVTTHQAGRPIWSWSQPDGTFELTELSPGALHVLVVAFGYQATPFDVDPFDADIAGTVLRLTLEREIGTPPTPAGLDLGPLAGSVDLGEHATPDAEYELLLMPTSAPNDAGGGFPARAPVGADGSFAFELVHVGEYRVVLLSPDDRGAMGPDLLASTDGETQLYTHTSAGDTPELTVESLAGAVSGVAFQETLVAGARRDTPVRGALIRVEPIAEDPTPGSEGEPAGLDTLPEGAIFRAVRTDGGGQYIVRDLAPGRYRLTVVAGSLSDEQVVEIPERTAVNVNVTPK